MIIIKKQKKKKKKKMEETAKQSKIQSSTYFTNVTIPYWIERDQSLTLCDDVQYSTRTPHSLLRPS